MNQEKQRIAIAEACGWVFKPNAFGWSPDYLNDLNAMHEVEQHLRPIQQARYYRLLREKIGSYELAISATASQRAEAFLRTIGKWEGAE